MTRKRQLVKIINKITKQVSKHFLSPIKKKIVWLLRTLFVTNRQRSSANAGFVLPTVAMVSIVVVLLTTAILFRSFERSKNASNVRVNQAVLNAAAPAIDRARAKIDKLFQDGRLPRAIPTDVALEDTLAGNLPEYTFGDETPLQLEEGGETLNTAWRYPVDTDNNGKFDSYTLYGIYFKTPLDSDRARNRLEARTPPMSAGSVSGTCADTLGTSATLVGNTGWFNIEGKLKKSFFVYTATVPITSEPTGAEIVNYERYQGNRGFSAIEYQQDRVQLPIVNNAVVYEDDIALAPGTDFNLNGRIFTNSNFITAPVGSAAVKLYQVSSKDSCFYDDDNAKIIIGGNLGAGGFTDATDLTNSAVLHLYQGNAVNPTLTGTNTTIKTNKSVTAGPSTIAYNSLAYVERINLLVDAQMANLDTTDPQEVIDGIQRQKEALGLPSYTAEENERFRRQQLGIYFRRRTRRVPYAEVAFGDDPVVGYTPPATVLQGSGNTLRPPDVWIYPTDPDDGKTGTGYTELALNIRTDKLLPSATEPIKRQTIDKEQTLGDRVLVGNNLPELWWNGSSFVGKNPQDTQEIAGIEWDDGDGTRTRRTRIEALADLGATSRDQDWELAAAKIPTNPQEPVGGLRVVTGAGIYLPDGLTTTSTSADFNSVLVPDSTGVPVPEKIWSDMMPVASPTAATAAGGIDPVIQLPNANTPYLRMRATAVYHYNVASYSQTAPAPIACVSSYYDPTNVDRAKNLNSLPWNPGTVAAPGASNNGVVYAAPDIATGETTYANVLSYQADLRYPNGRWVNKPLQTALDKTAANRTLSERSAVESALCALQILDDTIAVQSDPVIPHGAIRETAFLDARQIKAIHSDNTVDTPLVLETFRNAEGGAIVPPAADYNLPREQRQPLEIRATVLNINDLRGTTISGGVSTATEYLLPNSGIIYATRDDALLDLSAAAGNNQETESPVDFILDPTRRPNAIMLTNGEKIWRTNSYRDVERGLILASNLPVYIKGDFNIHTQEEFTNPLADSWGNFYSRTAAQRNPQFACRSGDQRLPNCDPGDEWRPASVLSDAITLLSSNFREGFRNQGDYDLNNNLGDATSITRFTENGFFPNSYVTNADWYDGSGIAKDLEPGITIDGQTVQGSSYLNNFVTPIQRRKNAPEYLMEVCPKLPVSECGVDDWYVHYVGEGDPANRRSWLRGGADTVPQIAIDGTLDWSILTLNAGTTAITDNNTRMYPRRVAFKRLPDVDPLSLLNGRLELNSLRPTILGIKDGKINQFPLGSFSAGNRPDSRNNALWFRTTTANNENTPPRLAEALTANTRNNPRLDPVLQIQNPTNDNDQNNTTILNTGSTRNWLQIATETTFNLAAAAGDTPARPTEDNGGLPNFVRFIENWNQPSRIDNAIKARISGSFIQFKRSAYATGPFRSFLSDSSESYPITGNSRRAPFYIAPTRQWGYDVGLLSQAPDLFAQKLVRTPEDLPDEFFREVGRDDPWVETLLCAENNAGEPAIDTDQRPSCP
ncbi:hormogonium polysaccharide biosynthesis protein HpsA [Nodularia sp. NIES-3585]|uniref:hormogonium polysaccharide biosynthesis protein HpsA n=1 Tax=Nodularia sp. NIES-3585 TaxID=1973477 RepID=UPI000B5C5D08|nr:hormogonium polysaccharide biosynthesis protein HpsA [Nodularia sp. NIES-3585]GAX36384.1 hypothetical protein NIES3585_24140 [Nodularia sp. NIES-3585]